MPFEFRTIFQHVVGAILGRACRRGRCKTRGLVWFAVTVLSPTDMVGELLRVLPGVDSGQNVEVDLD